MQAVNCISDNINAKRNVSHIVRSHAISCYAPQMHIATECTSHRLLEGTPTLTLTTSTWCLGIEYVTVERLKVKPKPRVIDNI